LTLEFQMMHEYISHVLPLWNSQNPLEEEFLLAVMFLYYRARGSRDGLVSLVREADQRMPGRHRVTRQFIKDELAPLQEERLTELLLELAVLREDEMSAAEKLQFLALLKKVPYRGDLKEEIKSWMQTLSVPALYQQLKNSMMTDTNP
jgi:hypothetical protein